MTGQETKMAAAIVRAAASRPDAVQAMRHATGKARAIRSRKTRRGIGVFPAGRSPRDIGLRRAFNRVPSAPVILE